MPLLTPLFLLNTMASLFGLSAQTQERERKQQIERFARIQSSQAQGTKLIQQDLLRQAAAGVRTSQPKDIISKTFFGQ